jgi:hypothetical protein
MSVDDGFGFDVLKIGNFAAADPTPVTSTGTFLTDAGFDANVMPTEGTTGSFSTGIWYYIDAYEGSYDSDAYLSLDDAYIDGGDYSLGFTRGVRTDGVDYYGILYRVFQNADVTAYQSKTLGIAFSAIINSTGAANPQLKFNVYFYDSSDALITSASGQITDVFTDTFGSEYVTVEDNAAYGTTNKWHRGDYPVFVPENAETMRIWFEVFRTDSTVNVNPIFIDTVKVYTYKTQVQLGNDGLNVYESPLNRLVLRTSEVSIRQNGFEFLSFNSSDQILVRLPNGRTGTIAVSNIN